MEILRQWMLEFVNLSIIITIYEVTIKKLFGKFLRTIIKNKLYWLFARIFSVLFCCITLLKLHSQALLSNGCDVNQLTTSGLNSCHLAAKYGHIGQ